MLYFIIRKYKSNYSESYRIEKHTDNLDEANKFLSALSLLEQDEYVSFFISAFLSKCADTKNKIKPKTISPIPMYRTKL